MRNRLSSQGFRICSSVYLESSAFRYSHVWLPNCIQVLSGKPTLQKLIKRAKLQYRFISVTAFLKTVTRINMFL
ncbi:hypothetical protein CapIbe_018187 [Capra ibex]